MEGSGEEVQGGIGEEGRGEEGYGEVKGQGDKGEVCEEVDDWGL